MFFLHQIPGIASLFGPLEYLPSKKIRNLAIPCSHPVQALKACVLMSVMRNGDLTGNIWICRCFHVRKAAYPKVRKLDFQVL
jgi:hypothetical protein